MKKKIKLDKEEREVMESVDRGEWRSVKNLKAEIKRYQDYAKTTFHKDKRINIRISSKDLYDIRKKAMEEGIPYQTLMASVLHKYVSGRLKEERS